jgi:hypothetical protein
MTNLPLNEISLPDGARLRLVEINGVLFAVLKCRAQKKRHQPPHDKKPGLSSDTTLYPHKKKTYRKIPVEKRIRIKKEKKYKQSDQPA